MAEPGPEPQNVPAPKPTLPAADPAAPQAPQQPGQQVVHLNWFLFKPEFSGKPDEDAESTSALHQWLDECTSFC